MFMTNFFLRMKHSILITFAAAVFAIFLNACSDADDDLQDAVYVKVAQKLAMGKFNSKGTHGDVEVFYYDAHKSKIYDALDPKDVDKLQEMKGYGTSPLLDANGYRSGAVGVPKGNFLKIEMNKNAEITGMFWVNEASPVPGK